MMKRRIVKKEPSVTKVLFITTQIAALVWVSVSYAIAAYATVKYGEAFPVVELSQQAIETILGVNVIKAETIVHALDRLEKKMGAKKFRTIFKSITVDNGTEFADTEGMEGSYINKKTQRTKLYYCHPYSSFERGTNENQNGMARRKHPKGTDFSKVTTRQIAETEAWMNDYPRPMFGYRSSNELFAEELARLGIAM